MRTSPSGAQNTDDSSREPANRKGAVAPYLTPGMTFSFSGDPNDKHVDISPFRFKKTAPARANCQITFLEYIPSEYEAKWAAAAPLVENRDGLCKLLHSTEFDGYTKEYIDSIKVLMPDEAGPKNLDCSREPPSYLDRKVFSRFIYQLKCPGKGNKNISTFIEPLVGLLRDPRVCKNENFLLHKGWLHTDPYGALTDIPARWFLFDLGASTWGEGAGGPSQSWFYHTYRTYCAGFTEIYAWEMSPVNHAKFFSEVPGYLRPGYHYFNHALSSTRYDWNNPLMHLMQRTKPEDYVVLKIDFDNSIMETQLIEQILESRTISSLIDEMYFEHHVNLEILRNHWGTGAVKDRHSKSLSFFSSLRKLGIRAHSWV